MIVSNAPDDRRRGARRRLRAAADGRSRRPVPWRRCTPAGAAPRARRRRAAVERAGARVRLAARGPGGGDRSEHRRAAATKSGTELVDAFAAAGHERHLIDRWFTVHAAAARLARAQSAAARRGRRQPRSAGAGRRAGGADPRVGPLHRDAPRRAHVVPRGEGAGGPLVAAIRAASGRVCEPAHGYRKQVDSASRAGVRELIERERDRLAGEELAGRERALRELECASRDVPPNRANTNAAGPVVADVPLPMRLGAARRCRSLAACRRATPTACRAWDRRPRELHRALRVAVSCT